MSRRRSSKTPRKHVLLPWIASGSFHLALLLLVVFVIYLLTQRDEDRSRVVIIPNTFEDPSFSDHPGLGGGSSDSMHPDLHDMGSTGWGQSSVNASMLDQPSGAVGIFSGSGASVTPGQPTNAASLAGTPGAGMSSAPRSSFMGLGGNGKKIVYILDHSGSMLDNFAFVKLKAVKSVNELSANQFFAVILVSDKVTAVGPAQLQRALPDGKAAFARLLQNEVAEGANDGLLEPFQQAFIKAFDMDPDLIYFLTDGKFGDGLIAKVAEMNKGKHVSINTLAFVTEEPQYKGALQQLAHDNGGNYTFVPQRDLGN